MKFWMYTSLLWMELCFVAITMNAEQIKENGWMVRAKNINDPMNLALFVVLVMFVPILRVIFFGTIYYMASTREEDSDI